MEPKTQNPKPSLAASTPPLAGLRITGKVQDASFFLGFVDFFGLLLLIFITTIIVIICRFLLLLLLILSLSLLLYMVSFGGGGEGWVFFVEALGVLGIFELFRAFFFCLASGPLGF